MDHVVAKYEMPEFDRMKKVVALAHTDILSASVQVIGEDGETNMHAHTASDEFWFVIGGRARFYGEGDVVTGDLGIHEGILVPRGSRYWFERVGDEPLEIIRFGASLQNVTGSRIDYSPMTESTRIAREQRARDVAAQA